MLSDWEVLSAITYFCMRYFNWCQTFYSLWMFFDVIYGHYDLRSNMKSEHLLCICYGYIAFIRILRSQHSLKDISSETSFLLTLLMIGVLSYNDSTFLLCFINTGVALLLSSDYLNILQCLVLYIYCWVSSSSLHVECDSCFFGLLYFTEVVRNA